MNDTRSRAATGRSFTALLVAALLCSVWGVLLAAPAYADFAGTALVAQDDGDKEIKTDNITLSSESFTFSGEIQKPKVTKVTVGEQDLVEGTHFTVSYSDDESKSAGTYKVLISAVAGSGFKTVDDKPLEKEYTIAQLKLSSCSLKSYQSGGVTVTSSAMSAQMYTGKDLKPTDIVLTASNSEVPAKWYTVSYSGEAIEESGEFIKTGNYTVTIAPSEDATKELDADIDAESTKTLTFTINKLNVTSCYLKSYKVGDADEVTSTSITAQTFTGFDIKPEIALKNGYSGSEVSSDLYDVTYADCLNAGTATITIAPKLNDNGTQNTHVLYGDSYIKKLTFTINKAQMSSNTVTYKAVPAQTYTGSKITPKVTNVKLGNYALTEGRDYTVSYGDNVSAGTGYVYLTGKGDNFNDSYRKSVSFTIKGKPLSSSDIKVSAIAAKTYTGASITPSVTVKDSKMKTTLNPYDSSKVSALIGSTPYQIVDGKYVALNFDYETSYSNNTNPGTAKVTITGMGNYTGSRTVSFKINGTGTIPKVKATNQGNGTVLLKWSPIYKATKYRVLEKQTNGSYRTLTGGTTYTACRISNLSVTRTHRFLVQAYVDKKWSSKSDAYLAKCKPTGATKPTIRAQSFSNTAILVSWAQVPGASAYALYEKVGKKFQLRTDSYTNTAVRFTNLKKKKSYTYYVRAKIDGKWYKASNKVTFSPADPNSPVPTASAVAGKKGQIKLTWEKPRNATKYMVEVQQGKTWRTLSRNCKALTYTAKGLSATKQTFRVRAYGNGKWSKIYTDYYASATPDNA